MLFVVFYLEFSIVIHCASFYFLVVGCGFLRTLHKVAKGLYLFFMF